VATEDPRIFLKRLKTLLNELAHEAPSQLPVTHVDFPTFKETGEGQETARE
jgi:hypothetical protein